MKRLALLFGLLFALTARANDVETDVTTVHTDASATELTDAHSPRHHRRHNARRKHRSGGDFGDFHVGFVTALGAPAGMNVDFWSSGEIGFAPAAYRWYTRSGKQNVSVSFGFNWRNYRMTGHNRFVKDGSGYLTVEPYPAAVASSAEFSRIKVFSLYLPLRYTVNLSDDWALSAGAILNFNTYASVETHYKEVTNFPTLDTKVTSRVQESIKKLHQRPVTVDFLAQLNWRGVGLYVKYSPCQVINPDWGPDFSSLSTGVSLGF